ncbi:MAG TPA: M1 family metallopeptidase [Gemmatimonadales bacterium]|nr:M1 family metallopeptidase [Gemmatimonadales bacterium]
MRSRLVPACLALVIAACAGRQVPAVVETPAPAQAQRPRPYPVFEPRGFARAVERGTRTRTGAAGHRYWQQWTRYGIAAIYDPTSGALDGRSTIAYFNRSPDSLDALYLHLHGNFFLPGAMRTRSGPTTGGVTLTRVSVRGREIRQFAPGIPDGYRVDGTILKIPMLTPVLAGDSVTLELAWRYTVPPDGAPRGGRDSTVSFVSYWYPQMAVYDDLNGWQIDPYRGNAEFYMGYGDYDVALTVPAGYLVGATGTLQNPGQVLRPEVRARLAAATRADTVIAVVTPAERGRATLPGTRGQVTWRFRAYRVRDFAWGTSDRYLWDATRAVTGDATGDGRPDTSAIYSYHIADAPDTWAESASFGRFSIEYLSRFLWPYPYPQASALQGPPSCRGMEYPMITCIGGAGWDSAGLFGVTVHELGHMWFPMQVGSDEKRFGWMDEGLTQFNGGNGEKEFFSEAESSTLSGARRFYLASVRAGQEVELMRHGDLYPGPEAYARATYMKPAALLDALRGMLGEETFMRAYREYGRRWQWKHPDPLDFFNTFNDVTGRDLDWFWRTWFYETWALDQAVGSVTPSASGTAIVIEDHGLAAMPANVTVTYEGGRIEQLTIPVETWLRGARQATVTAPAGTVTRVEIDASKVYLDADRANNVWEGGAAARSR